ncbi:MAG: hypothetical protein KGL56_00185 [Alphaproteobacteria bacterium]|nr:hypothetical protein [Alphaproteobacteria bacterium]
MEKPRLDIRNSYLAMVENSEGSRMFRNRFYIIDGQSLDVLEDGDLSCAEYVSSVLYLFGLIAGIHTTVVGCVEDMLSHGWQAIPEPRQGAIIHWDFKKLDDGTRGKNRHLGFYWDAEAAYSNDPVTRAILRHHPTYGTREDGEPRRDILGYFWHPALDA